MSLHMTHLTLYMLHLQVIPCINHKKNFEHKVKKVSVDEPEADQFFGVKKSVNLPPGHYGVTHIQCRDLQEAVTLRPDETLKRTYLSMWADTYYIDPFKVSADTLTLLTVNSQVNQN